LEKPALLCPLVHAVLGNEALGTQRTTLGTHRMRGQDGATLDAYLRSLEQQATKLRTESGCRCSQPQPQSQPQLQPQPQPQPQP
jgi:hypothetical protein